MQKKGNKSKKWVLLLWIVLLLLLAVTVKMIVTEKNARTTITFEENQGMVENPFQGAYFQWSTGAAEEIYDVIEEHPDYSVIMLTYNLDDEMEMETLPEKKLGDLEQSLSIAEELGLSVIFRAAYDFIGEYEDPEFNIMLSHIEQMSVILNAHKECIMGVQAGMIGAFGEWTQSKYMDTKSYGMQIIEAWEEALDPEIHISVRRQKFIRDAMEWGLDTARLGVYNDGLFSSESDLGTYREAYNREEDLAWSEENIRVPFNGGEMPFISEFTDIVNVVKEAGQLNLSYLNQEYNHKVWEFWADQTYEGMSGDAYIKSRLGCRPWIKSLDLNKHIKWNRTLYIEAEIANSGFAMINPNYHMYFVLTCGERTVYMEAEGGMESKETGTIFLQLDNPFSREEIEEYGMTVGLTISKEEIEQAREAYCLQLVNRNITYESGVNVLWELEPEKIN